VCDAGLQLEALRVVLELGARPPQHPLQYLRTTKLFSTPPPPIPLIFSTPPLPVCVCASWCFAHCIDAGTFSLIAACLSAKLSVTSPSSPRCDTSRRATNAKLPPHEGIYFSPRTDSFGPRSLPCAHAELARPRTSLLTHVRSHGDWGALGPYQSTQTTNDAAPTTIRPAPTCPAMRSVRGFPRNTTISVAIWRPAGWPIGWQPTDGEKLYGGLG